MKGQSFTTTIVVDSTPNKAFAAITDPRAWWSEEIYGGTSQLNDEFTYHYKDVHKCRIQIEEVLPNEKVVWLVLDNYFNFTKDRDEWKGTKVSFEITELNGKTQVNFTHQGLYPQYECYDICSNAWSGYINSLRELILTGKGLPNAKERASA